MPVYEASYRSWEGKARRSPRAGFAITAVMLRRLWRMRLLKWMILTLLIITVAMSTVVFYVNYDETLSMLQRHFGGGASLLHFVYRQFYQMAFFFGVVTAAVAGAPLISEDRRQRALPLYFSRPITHFEYVYGKLLTVAALLAILVLVPPVCMYGIDVLLTKQAGAAAANLPDLGASFLPGMAIVVTLSCVALGFSALFKRSTYAALTCFAVLLFSAPVSDVLRNIFQAPDLQAIAPSRCVRTIVFHLFPMPFSAARHHFFPTFDVGYAWLGLAAWTAAGLFVLLSKVRRVEVVT